MKLYHTMVKLLKVAFVNLNITILWLVTVIFCYGSLLKTPGPITILTSTRSTVEFVQRVIWDLLN